MRYIARDQEERLRGLLRTFPGVLLLGPRQCGKSTMAKRALPGWACLAPVYNMIVFLRIVGRPASHLFLFLIPVVSQLYFLPKVWIETAQSFGKRTILDYVLVVVLNGLYILNLGMSYDSKYYGPVYGKDIPTTGGPLKPRPSLA